MQRQALEQKQSQMDQAIAAIRKAELSTEGGNGQTRPFKKGIIEVIEMQKETEWMKQYYTAEAQAKVEERKALWTPELQVQVEKDWKSHFAEVNADIAAGEDAGSPTVQALADR